MKTSNDEVPVTIDPLFVGMTRPTMMMGVTYSYFVINMTATSIIFLATSSLLALLISLPVHGLGMLACAKDPRFFDLIFQWLKSCPPVQNRRFWHANSYMP